MYRKSVRKLRHDPLTDRGALEPVTHFGQRIATDFIVVQKLGSNMHGCKATLPHVCTYLIC